MEINQYTLVFEGKDGAIHLDYQKAERPDLAVRKTEIDRDPEIVYAVFSGLLRNLIENPNLFLEEEV